MTSFCSENGRKCPRKRCNDEGLSPDWQVFERVFLATLKIVEVVVRQASVTSLSNTCEVVSCRCCQSQLAEVIHDPERINVVVVLWDYILHSNAVGLTAFDQKWVWCSIFKVLSVLLDEVVPVAAKERIEQHDVVLDDPVVVNAGQE